MVPTRSLPRLFCRLLLPCYVTPHPHPPTVAKSYTTHTIKHMHTSPAHELTGLSTHRECDAQVHGTQGQYNLAATIDLAARIYNYGASPPKQPHAKTQFLAESS